MAVRVQSADFEPGEELAKLAKDCFGAGAVASFIGLCRGRSHGREVTAMVLEHYPAMTERALEEIEAQAHRRWQLEGSVIIHRHGRLLPGDRIVFVAVAAAHREAAFAACAFLVDWLKTRAPFWKCEETPDGPLWVDARAEDDAAAARWNRE